MRPRSPTGCLVVNGMSGLSRVALTCQHRAPAETSFVLNVTVVPVTLTRVAGVSARLGCDRLVARRAKPFGLRKQDRPRGRWGIAGAARRRVVLSAARRGEVHGDAGAGARVARRGCGDGDVGDRPAERQRHMKHAAMNRGGRPETDTTALWGDPLPTTSSDRTETIEPSLGASTDRFTARCDCELLLPPPHPAMRAATSAAQNPTRLFRRPLVIAPADGCSSHLSRNADRNHRLLKVPTVPVRAILRACLPLRGSNACRTGVGAT